ncbi:MAG: glycosyltransferase [Anaerolineae bacterium]
MKILHVYKDYNPVLGGIENHIRLLAEGQAAAGHEVTVLVTSQGRRTSVETLGGVRVIKTARLAHVASTPLSVALPLALRRERPDITHLHFPYPPGEVSQLLLGRSRRTVLSYHSDVVRQAGLLRIYAPLMRRVLASVDRILVGTPNVLETSPVLPPYAHKCQVLPYGIARERFLTLDAAKASAIRRSLGGGPLVLFVGVLRYYKGLNYLLEAMQEVPAQLVVVGDGPMGAAWRAQAKALGIAERVAFLGRIDDDALPAYYGAADLFVLPACERSEAFGLVQVEAMSAGLPVVCTDVGTGTTYVNRHGESGLVVPPRDPQALAGAIKRLLDDEALRLRLAEGAQARSALFDRDRMLADVESVYRQLLA